MRSFKATVVFFAVLALGACTAKPGNNSTADLPSVQPPSPPPITVEELKAQEIQSLKAELPSNYLLTPEELELLKEELGGNLPDDLGLLTKNESDSNGGAQ